MVEPIGEARGRPRAARLAGALAVLLLLGAASSSAQPPSPAPAARDSLDAILSDPATIVARLDHVGLPMRSPTQDELRQYLEAFRVVGVSASLRVERPSATARTRGGNVSLGPFRVPNGSELRVSVGFDKRPGDPDAVLRTLEIVPLNPQSGQPVSVELLGPFARFVRAYLDDTGAVHLQLNKLAGEVTIDKVRRDAAGNLVFGVSGTGIADAVTQTLLGSEVRILPDGRMERYSRGWFLLGRLFGLGVGWKPLEAPDLETGKIQPVKLDRSIPIKRWPPHAPDLLDWLPQEGAAGANPGNELDKLRPVLEAIPISDVSLTFDAKADPKTIRLSGPKGEPGQGGSIELTDHELHWDARGRFTGRTYHTTPGAETNRLKATGAIRGELIQPGMRARIDRSRLSVDGTHSAIIPFEDLRQTRLDSALSAHAELGLGNVRVDLPTGGSLIAPGEAGAGFDGSVQLVLRAPGASAAERSQVMIDRDKNVFTFSASGPLTIGDASNGGSALAGVTLPHEITVVAADDPATAGVDESRGPVVSGRGQLGSRGGFLLGKIDLQVHGQTTTPGAVGVLKGAGAQTQDLRVRLRPGAQAHVDAHTLVGVSKDAVDAIIEAALRGQPRTTPLPSLGSANARLELRLSAGASELSAALAQMTADFRGAADVQAHLTSRVHQRLQAARTRPIALALDLAMSFAPGSTVSAARGPSRGRVALRGATRVTLHAEGAVDATTGWPGLRALRGVDLTITAGAADLQALLVPLKLTVSLSSRRASTVRLKGVNVELPERGGLRITHQGVSVDLAPGPITITP